MKYLVVVAVSLCASTALAQEAQKGADPDRARAAAPHLAQALHDAVDNIAICQGDADVLRLQLAAANAELEKLKKAAPK